MTRWDYWLRIFGRAYRVRGRLTNSPETFRLKKRVQEILKQKAPKDVSELEQRYERIEWRFLLASSLICLCDYNIRNSFEWATDRKQRRGKLLIKTIRYNDLFEFAHFENFTHHHLYFRIHSQHHINKINIVTIITTNITEITITISNIVAIWLPPHLLLSSSGPHQKPFTFTTPLRSINKSMNNWISSKNDK